MPSEVQKLQIIRRLVDCECPPHELQHADLAEMVQAVANYYEEPDSQEKQAAWTGLLPYLKLAIGGPG